MIQKIREWLWKAYDWITDIFIGWDMSIEDYKTNLDSLMSELSTFIRLVGSRLRWLGNEAKSLINEPFA